MATTLKAPGSRAMASAELTQAGHGTPGVGTVGSQAATVAVIWIDWYAYHLARLRALIDEGSEWLRPIGIELVGGEGVHAGMNFRGAGHDSLPVVTLFPGQSWRGAGQLRIAREVWRRLQSEQPSAVMIPGYYTLPAIAASLWAKWNRRTAVLMTESTEGDHARSGWKEALKGALIRNLFDCAIAGGEPHIRYLEKLGVPRERIGRFYDVVDNDYFRGEAGRCRWLYRREDFQLPADYFLYVGRLSAEKNVDGLLRAFAEYRQTGGEWSLVLVGDGAEKAGLQDLSEKLGIAADVVWAGLKKTDELVPYYSFASAFVLPSHREPWGLVVNEALACGVPALVSKRCGCVEDLMRDGENGYVFDPARREEFAGVLRRMSVASVSERERMANCAQVGIAQYSPRNWAQEVERLLSERQRRGVAGL